MITRRYNNWTITLLDEPSDSTTTYDKVYQLEVNKRYDPVSRHAIVVYEDEIKLASALLLASAGATTVTPDSLLIDDGRLITRCCNQVFSMTLPGLHLNWITTGDEATCFAIHPYQNSYIVHGELSVSRIDREGNVCWQFTGADIFVLPDGKPAFLMHEDYIDIYDFNGTLYQIDYDGKIK